MAPFRYAIRLSDGREIAKNLRLAAHYLKLASDQGHIDATLAYACALLYGTGVPANPQAAGALLQKLADRDHRPSLELLGQLHRTGSHGFRKDAALADTLLKRAAGGDEGSRRRYLQSLIDDGRAAEALPQMKKAADSGDAIDQCHYAIQLLNANRDDPEADFTRVMGTRRFCTRPDYRMDVCWTIRSLFIQHCTCRSKV
jgi:TPR repeat protein